MNRFALDTNVVIYLLTDAPRSVRVEALLTLRPVISVQLLNEATLVLRRKLKVGWTETAIFVANIARAASRVTSVTIEDHVAARRIAERYQLGFYDSCLLASALNAGCDSFFSQDMHTGLVIDDRLTIRNPFA